MAGFVEDLAALFARFGLARAAIVGHSLGGNIALRYAELFPETVTHVVSIEGLGPSPAVLARHAIASPATLRRAEIAERQRLFARPPRVYPTIDEAARRMQAVHPWLTPALAAHLARHGLKDATGGHVWKFDPLLRRVSSAEGDQTTVNQLLRRIACPTLLVYGGKSWASNPGADGRLANFGPNARLKVFADSGHWLHHQEPERFNRLLAAFLSPDAAPAGSGG